MTTVVFETPGLIDLRAFTIMGAHAKPNTDSPIGFFGTGLKYAIAVLVRMGCKPVVWIGKDKVVFSNYSSSFRGQPLDSIKMSVHKAVNKRATSYELPFTTRYGAKWEPWMAFRELESNTRDERGKTWLVDTDGAYADGSLVPGLEGHTRIIVDHPDFVAAAQAIDTIFLPRGKRTGTLVEVHEGESQFIYYRTMRAYDVPKPTLFTYNVLEQMDLTEDRTLKNQYSMRNCIARWVVSEANQDQVEEILAASEDNWEHKMDFPSWIRPSDAFMRVMNSKKRGLSREAWSYAGYWAPKARAVVQRVWEMFQEYPRPWAVEGDVIVDKNGEPVLARPAERSDEEWELIGNKIIRLLRALPVETAKPVVEESNSADDIPF